MLVSQASRCIYPIKLCGLTGSAEMALASIQQLRVQGLASPINRSRELERSSFFVGMISQCLTDDSECVALITPLSVDGPPPSSEIDLDSPLRGQILKFIQHWYLAHIQVDTNY